MFFFCPDGIIPNSGLTGPNNTYIYILNTTIYICFVCVDLIKCYLVNGARGDSFLDAVFFFNEANS